MERTRCSYHDSNRLSSNTTDEYEVDPLPGSMLDHNTVLCPGNDNCFSVWQVVEKGNDSEIVIIKQGTYRFYLLLSQYFFQQVLSLNYQPLRFK